MHAIHFPCVGFAAKDSEPMYVGWAAMPTLSFWGLDGSIPIKNYDAVKKMNEDEIDFATDTDCNVRCCFWGYSHK